MYYIVGFLNIQGQLIRTQPFLYFCKVFIYPITQSLDIHFWPEINTFVSSANRTDKKEFDTVAKSLLYIKNNKGPRINPWGTPQVIFTFVDFIELYATYCDLFAK